MLHFFGHRGAGEPNVSDGGIVDVWFLFKFVF